MSRTLKVTGYHAKLARFVLLPVSEEAENMKTFFRSIIKQLLDSVFVISRIINVSVRVISLSLRLTETLIILDITKPETNNCFIIH